jgi:CheY-like chemotaxis protein
MTKKILVVDDSATARGLFKACFFNNPDYEIIQASQWQDALDKALLHNPFLIVLDYNMPDKTGSELAQIMQENQIEANYVLLTANTQESVLDEVSNLGFLQVIEKPISPESIESLLNKIHS